MTNSVLHAHEILLIAHLADNQGFKLLLDAIQADMDTVLDEVEEAKTDEEERRKLTLWKAYRKVLSRLRELPESFKQLTNEALQAVDENSQPLTESNIMDLYTPDEIAQAGGLSALISGDMVH